MTVSYDYIMNVPVFVNGDYTKQIGSADVFADGTVTVRLVGSLGEEFKQRVLDDALKSVSLGYEYTKAVPSVPVQETEICCVDGADGLTPDMLRQRKDENTFNVQCGMDHEHEGLTIDAICICGRGLFFRSLREF